MATSSSFNSVRAILQPSLSTSLWLTGVSGCESDGVSDDGSAWTFGGALIVGGFLGAAGRKNESSRATLLAALGLLVSLQVLVATESNLNHFVASRAA